MKIYVVWGFFEGGKNDIIFNEIPRILFSYWTIVKGQAVLRFNQAVSEKKDIFLDSGAFSAMTLGAKLDLGDYCELIKANGIKTYANLDVIGNAAASLRNQRAMERHGLKPIPCFHIGENFGYLKGYLQDYDYVALGVAGRQNTEAGREFVDNCFAVIRDYWPKRIHGFGITGQKSLLRYPFYSVDSSSTLAGAGYGRVWTMKRGKISTDSYRNPRTGARYFDCVDKGETARVDRAFQNVLINKRLEQFVTAAWEKRGVKW